MRAVWLRAERCRRVAWGDCPSHRNRPRVRLMADSQCTSNVGTQLGCLTIKLTMFYKLPASTLNAVWCILPVPHFAFLNAECQRCARPQHEARYRAASAFQKRHFAARAIAVLSLAWTEKTLQRQRIKLYCDDVLIFHRSRCQYQITVLGENSKARITY